MPNLKKLQQVIGYKFKDEGLLCHALSHSSYANEKHLGREGSNERLEFLGDAVLELISSDFFFHYYKNKPEGELTRIRASFVCEPALDYCAKSIPLGDYLMLGKGEETTGGRTRPSIVSDAFEALIGAVYLDGGFANAKELVLKFILNDIEHKQFFYDSKTILQEELNKAGLSAPEYKLIAESGPDHQKEFEVSVMVDGVLYGSGIGSSKKHAEQLAAYEALKKLKNM